MKLLRSIYALNAMRHSQAGRHSQTFTDIHRHSPTFTTIHWHSQTFTGVQAKRLYSKWKNYHTTYTVVVQEYSPNSSAFTAYSLLLAMFFFLFIRYC